MHCAREAIGAALGAGVRSFPRAGRRRPRICAGRARFLRAFESRAREGRIPSLVGESDAEDNPSEASSASHKELFKPFS